YKEGFLCFTPPSSLRERVITCKGTAKQQKITPSSSSTSTSVSTNLDLEIVQKVFGSLPEKTMDFEFFD
ncbi:6072_t:CDS:2, partial [Funneliformis geosporum]